MTTALVAVGDLERMAQAVSASKLFGITTPEQAMALMLVAQAEGLHPATAARDYHIIQGRPTLKADAMLARYLASGGKVEWGVHTDTEVEATFSHPQGGTLKIKWDMGRAKVAQLTSPMWTKYPRQMLRARVISEGVRATNPAVAVGIYTPEEAEDFEPAAKPSRGAKAKDMGTAEVVPPFTDATEDREITLTTLCKQAKISPEFYLNRLKVQTASEIKDDDWPGIIANLKAKIAAAEAKAAA